MTDKIVRYDKTHNSLVAGLAEVATRVNRLDLEKPNVEFEIQKLAVVSANARDLAKDRRAREIAPFETPLKEIKARWAPLVEGFEGCITRLKSDASVVLKRKREEEERKRREAEARLQAARDAERKLERERIDLFTKGASQSPDAPVTEGAHKQALTDLRAAREAVDRLPPAGAPIGVKSESGTLSGRDVVKWEVEDINMIPDAYVQRLADTRKIDLAVRNGARNIPGIRVFTDTVMAVRKAARK